MEINKNREISAPNELSSGGGRNDQKSGVSHANRVGWQPYTQPTSNLLPKGLNYPRIKNIFNTSAVVNLSY